MDRAALLALDKPALVEMVLELLRANAALTARVAELEARLAKLESPPKTPGNSSVPPSQARKPNRAERRQKKRGPKRGHAGASRPRVVPDAVLSLPKDRLSSERLPGVRGAATAGGPAADRPEPG